MRGVNHCMGSDVCAIGAPIDHRKQRSGAIVLGSVGQLLRE